MTPRRCTRGELLLFGVWLGQMMLLGMALAQGAPKVHELRPTPDTVHRGFFDASLKPVLTIDSGDIVRVWTASGNPRYYENLGVPREDSGRTVSRVRRGRGRAPLGSHAEWSNRGEQCAAGGHA